MPTDSASSSEGRIHSRSRNTLGTMAGLLVASALLVLFGLAASSASADVFFASKWGSAGSGAGQISYAQTVAADPSGNVYVTESENNRISEFSSAGAFIKAYGWGVDTDAPTFETCTTASTCQAGNPGDGAGQFDLPTGVATDASGNVYVTDAHNERVNEFSSAGAFIKAYGWGVATGAAGFETCTTASTCQAGIAGGGAGQLNAPYAIAIDASGNVYVGDYNNQRISEFSSAGAFIKAYGWGVDTGAATYETCTTASTCQVAIPGGGAGQLHAPDGVATDASGNVYVGDAGNNRVSEFSSTGAFIKAYGWGVDTGAATFEACTTASTCQAGIPGGGTGQLSGPSDLSTDAYGNLYVADFTNNRISEFYPSGAFMLTFGWGVTNGGHGFEVCYVSCQAGISGSGDGQLKGVRGVAADAAGNVYTTDDNNNRIEKFMTSPSPGRPNWPRRSDRGHGDNRRNRAQGTAGKNGKDAKVTCKVKRIGKTKIRVTCTVTLASRRRGTLRWRLTRRGRTYEHGALNPHNGRATLRIPGVNRLPRGRYTLRITGGAGGTAFVIG